MFVLFALSFKAQNIGINTTGAVPNAAAMLDISSTSLGLLIPRMTFAQKNAIALPAAGAQGLLVYQTNTSTTFLQGFYYNSSTTSTATWNYIGVAVPGWAITGNAGTTEATNFIGTTDNNALVFKVNGVVGGRIGVLSDINTNFGYSSLLNGALAGSSNAAFGTYSLQSVSSGTYNSGLGASSLKSNTTGSNNTATGASVLQLNSSGSYNTGTGFQSLFSNSTGNNNSATGVFSMLTNTTGYSNTASGMSSLYKNTTGSRNTATGDSAMFSNTTSSNNVATGYSAMYSNTTGSNNAATGYSSLFSNTTGYSNTAVGYSSIKNNVGGYRNSGLGDSVLFSNTSGYNNSAIGFYSLGKNTTGYSNSAVGINTLNGNLTGNENSAVGVNALFSNISGSGNSAFGISALYSNSSGNYNTALGYQSLYSNNLNSGIGNTATGAFALNANTGSNNTANGVYALFGNTLGTYNSAFGWEALYGTTSGIYNIAIGAYAGYNVISPSNSNTTGSYNIYIGANAGQGTSTQLNNAIAIGKNALVNVNNAMVLGGTGADKVFVGIGTSSPAAELDVCGSGRITGTFNVGGVLSSSTGIACSSDKRYKKNILPLNNALNNVLKLQGVTYNWRKDEFPDKGFTDNTQIGFIAQDIEKIFPQMVFTDDKGYKSVDYSRLTPVLVEALKAQQKIIDTQNQSINELKAEVKDIQASLKYNGLVKPFTIDTTSVSAEKK